jgi:hypothetical protein
LNEARDRIERIAIQDDRAVGWEQRDNSRGKKFRQHPRDDEEIQVRVVEGVVEEDRTGLGVDPTRVLVASGGYGGWVHHQAREDLLHLGNVFELNLSTSVRRSRTTGGWGGVKWRCRLLWDGQCGGGYQITRSRVKAEGAVKRQLFCRVRIFERETGGVGESPPPPLSTSQSLSKRSAIPPPVRPR